MNLRQARAPKPLPTLLNRLNNHPLMSRSCLLHLPQVVCLLQNWLEWIPVAARYLVQKNVSISTHLYLNVVENVQRSKRVHRDLADRGYVLVLAFLGKWGTILMWEMNWCKSFLPLKEQNLARVTWSCVPAMVWVVACIFPGKPRFSSSPCLPMFSWSLAYRYQRRGPSAVV